MTPQSMLYRSRIGGFSDGDNIRNRSMEQFNTSSGNPYLPIFNIPSRNPSGQLPPQQVGPNPILGIQPVGGPGYAGPVPVPSTNFPVMGPIHNGQPQISNPVAMPAFPQMPRGQHPWQNYRQLIGNGGLGPRP